MYTFAGRQAWCYPETTLPLDTSDREGNNRYSMRRKHILAILFLFAAAAGRLILFPAPPVSAQVACAGIPFTDVTDTVFCAVIRTAYFTGLTSGTSATTFSPVDSVNREQSAAFASRALTGGAIRANRRAALNFFWTPVSGAVIATIGTSPTGVASDGQDLWIADGGSQRLYRVSHTGAVLSIWTGLSGAADVVVTSGRIIVTGTNSNIYAIDPSQSGAAASATGSSPFVGGVGTAYDGQKIWRPSATATTLSLINSDGTYLAEYGPVPAPVRGVFCDGTYVWIVGGDGTLRRVQPFSFAASDLALGSAFSSAVHMAFDGTNLWIPDPDTNQVFVVRPASQTVIGNVSGNGLSGPNAVAFDGIRMVVTNKTGGSVSLFQAVDLTPLGSIALPSGAVPAQVASDGVNFFVIASGSGQLMKF